MTRGFLWLAERTGTDNGIVLLENNPSCHIDIATNLVLACCSWAKHTSQSILDYASG